MKAIAQVMIVVTFFAGCATKRAGIEERRFVTKTHEVLVRQVDYSPKGLPIYSNQLRHRPSKAGDQFTIAEFTDNLPVTSFDIVVVGPNADFSKPFKVVYKWTGKGFEAGKAGSAVMLELATGAPVNNCEEAVLLTVVVVSPMVVGAAGGFLIGFADGIKTTAEEAGKVMLGNFERVVTYTTYAYDARDRLFLMRMYRADDSRQELVRTEYLYEPDSPEPIKIVITTYPNGAVKILE